jgi:Acyclic terpene utilisation family protein AtuA
VEGPAEGSRRGLRADLPGSLGGWGIAAALRAGADVVVCPRVTDASLVVGPAAAWHGWGPADLDELAGAVVAGHVIECGPQATGGNYPFLNELPDLRYPGFPIAEVGADGSSVITKHPGTDGPDRVRISGTRGSPPPENLKVALNYLGGYRNTMTMVLTGLDIEEKAARAEAMLFELLGGKERFGEADVRLIRSDRPDAPTNARATAQLRITVSDPDPAKVGRSFSNATIELALAGYAGCCRRLCTRPELSRNQPVITYSSSRNVTRGWSAAMSKPARTRVRRARA